MSFSHSKIVSSLSSDQAIYLAEEKKIHIEKLTEAEAEKRFREMLNGDELKVRERDTVWFIYQNPTKQNYSIIYSNRNTKQIDGWDEPEVLSYYLQDSRWEVGTRSGSIPNTPEIWERLWKQLLSMGIKKEFCLNKENGKQLDLDNDNNNVNPEIDEHHIELSKINGPENYNDYMRFLKDSIGRGLVEEDKVWMVVKLNPFVLHVVLNRACHTSRTGFTSDKGGCYFYTKTRSWQRVERLAEARPTIELQSLSVDQQNDFWQKLNEDGLSLFTRVYPPVHGPLSPAKVADDEKVDTDQNIDISEMHPDEARTELMKKVQQRHHKVGTQLWFICQHKLHPGTYTVSSCIVKGNNNFDFTTSSLSYTDNRWQLNKIGKHDVYPPKTAEVWQDLWTFLDEIGLKKENRQNAKIIDLDNNNVNDAKVSAPTVLSQQNSFEVIFDDILIEPLTNEEAIKRINEAKSEKVPNKTRIWAIRPSTNYPGAYVVHYGTYDWTWYSNEAALIGYMNGKWQDLNDVTRDGGTISDLSKGKENLPALEEYLRSKEDCHPHYNKNKKGEIFGEILIEKISRDDADKRINEAVKEMPSNAKEGASVWFIRKCRVAGAFALHRGIYEKAKWNTNKSILLVAFKDGKWNLCDETDVGLIYPPNDEKIWQALLVFLATQNYFKDGCINAKPVVKTCSEKLAVEASSETSKLAVEVPSETSKEASSEAPKLDVASLEASIIPQFSELEISVMDEDEDKESDMDLSSSSSSDEDLSTSSEDELSSSSASMDEDEFTAPPKDAVHPSRLFTPKQYVEVEKSNTFTSNISLQKK